ncbi:hypothetical protein SEA_UNPHAZED_14 [Microbacterium phage Unphazed]|uniref:Uncharacterized protein n=5 Tax=Tinytimothyvirus alex44 TaxID=2845588 RepID=A0A7G9A0E7_9CAUD|nr:hypothetical protein HWC34_gp14 [Microbacterium phage Alex44]AZV01776.1 hypothetical protein SEA_ARMAWEN_13 [Microbacterium phage ArMaWen]QDF16042.1 hypothetical protein SEA_LILYLOU_14 [Microbacterium phage LilyLou]QJD52758.1 hypothetical protein SEA_UNPHAZED_14 [Microbacterium phage Unphazed]QJD52812.1 hypothetical protein SEA_PHOGO_14 [Microbacterium phage Phogo]QNL30086.1 hypothetical protein SEA_STORMBREAKER_13 [Microbacterium phage Stormbreaker]QPX62658.1 hypothetical protein SEA_XITL
MKWCEFEWDGDDGERYRCTQLADHEPKNVHTSENGQLHVEHDA